MIYLKDSAINLVAYLFVFFPIQYKFDQVNVSINYIFIFIFLYLSRGRIENIKSCYKVIWIYFISSLLFGVIALLAAGNFSAEMVARMFFSWLLVVSPFSILFFKFNLDLISFKKSIVIISVLYSLAAIYFLFVENFSKGIFFPQMIKSSMAEIMPEWPDRFTPILVLAAFILYFDGVGYGKLVRSILVLILSVVLLFTFSRAIYIGIVFVVLLKSLISLICGKIKFKSLVSFIFYFLFALFAISLIDVVEDIFSNIFNYIFESFETFSDSVGDSNSSAGARFDRLNYLSSLILYSPLGHGGLGISNINADFGSSESQYIDYLVRFGFPGVFIMLYIHLKTYIKAKNDILLRGFPEYIVFLIIFGVFHETIRLPYILLSILIILKSTQNYFVVYEKNRGYKSI